MRARVGAQQGLEGPRVGGWVLLPGRGRAGSRGRQRGCPRALRPRRLIQHTKDLMQSEEKLCVKVLRTLQQMLLKKAKYGDRVSPRPARAPGPGLGGRR